MKTHKNPAEERENLLIQAQNLYKQKYEKFPEEEGYKIHHIDNKEIIFATSADSLKAYLKHKHRETLPSHGLVGMTGLTCSLCSLRRFVVVRAKALHRHTSVCLSS